jgi:hypothetical protein
MMFFDGLRRFIFVFGGRKLLQNVNSPLSPHPEGDQDGAPKEIGTRRPHRK